VPLPSACCVSFANIDPRYSPQLPRCQSRNVYRIQTNGGQPFPSKIYLLVMVVLRDLVISGWRGAWNSKFKAWAGS
jgi:hypothetical protein